MEGISLVVFLVGSFPYQKGSKVFMLQKTITIEQARSILKKNGREMSDAEIEDILRMLRLLCSKTIDKVIEKNHPKNYEG